MAFEVATKLNGEVITSSSFFTFKALRLMPKAAVPEFTAIIYFDLTIFLIYSQIYLQKTFIRNKSSINTTFHISNFFCQLKIMKR